MRRKVFLVLVLIVFVAGACVPTPEFQDPWLIYTVVASTQTAAALQTQMAEDSFTKTPTAPVLRPTFTPFPTMTSFVYNITASPTRTSTPAPTGLPPVLTSWPDWRTGEVVTMPKGSGANIGVNKRFSVLAGVEVMVVRRNGVKLRTIPNKAQPGVQEDQGGALTLTGVMNINGDFNWIFVQVIAVDGNTYWVGGTEGEDTDPRNCFIFYYPHLTTSPTPSATGTGTPTLTPSKTPTPSQTPSPTP